ncbi:hypothetical protein [Rhodococcus sp. R1101]|uniref:hypothetical protein n=1 Tax=Rhodococcus sp. R1101 TaxID=1170698 RepID=UPI000363F0DA|nr:hypothetical protein [Rhodococcus sp. R1101]
MVRTKPAVSNGAVCGTAHTVGLTTHDKGGLRRKQPVHAEHPRVSNTSHHDCRYIVDIRKVEPPAALTAAADPGERAVREGRTASALTAATIALAMLPVPGFETAADAAGARPLLLLTVLLW